MLKILDELENKIKNAVDTISLLNMEIEDLKQDNKKLQQQCADKAKQLEEENNKLRKEQSDWQEKLKLLLNKFEEVEFYLGETGCPIISDTLGYVECRVVGAVEEGDHTVYVGEVIGAGVHREGDPLLLENTGWNYGG